MRPIPVSAPDLSGNEETYVLDAIRSTWISSTGPYVEKFESVFGMLCKANSAIAVCNGTVALHLAMLGLDVRPGDEVLVPSLTYVATANAVRYVGAEPVFVDVDAGTWCIDPLLLERGITRRTKGIIAVHLYGHPADMDAINRIAAIHGLWVVEDAAEAHFATYKGRPTGTLARIGTFSFYGNKILTCGEGGAVVVDDPLLDLRLRTLRGQGMDPERRYYHPVTGYNFRLTNVACAILCAQIERHKEFIARRREIVSLYKKLLGDRCEYQHTADWAEPAPWMMCVRFPSAQMRDAVAARLRKEQIDTRPFFVPLHQLPPFREKSAQRGEKLPVTEAVSETGLCLPTFTGLSDSDVERICAVIQAET